MTEIGYQPGWDVERYKDGHWFIFRTTKNESVEVAHGRSTLHLIAASYWHRLTHPLRDWERGH